ncbi:nucleolar protein 53 [Mytilus galloprovincialis]|uniref:Ribosome biogenesis protein NOP53 n=2 Tax=Mytilus galloprovincialis TaxID=29158 RepID=A0A8B6CQK6_MYTGA|nr:nucleolar protein 53 [Mytilus galloprovincialis]
MENKQQTRKKLRISKNKKKGWKKTDITEVEEFLEDQRLQERTGGLVAEKKDEQLFIVDKAPEEEPQIQRKRKKKDITNLKCHSHLQFDPRIKPARIAHNLRKPGVERRHERVVERIKSGKKTATEIQAQKQSRADRKLKRETRRKEHRLFKKSYDLWGTENTEEDLPVKKQKFNPPKHHREKPTLVSNVEIPHPGASYNPAFDDYQALIEKAHNVEVKKAKKEQKLYNALDAKFKKLDKAEIEKTWLTEMSAGLADDDTVEDNDIGDLDLDKISVNPPVQREKKKTKIQRNKEKKLKQQEKLQKTDKAKKLRANEIFRLKSLKKEVKEKEKKVEQKKEARLKREAANKTKTRKIGKMKFEEPNLEIKLTDELEGSLRLLKPEGHLFEDRFKSLQKRSIIEPRVQARHTRKYKPKVFDKRSHREEGS